MALNTELILTLKNLKGCGNKTVLSIAEVASSQVQTIKDLCDFWTTLKGKKFEKFTTTDLHEAYDPADYYEEEKTYDNYNGSYAQDVEGWSDQDIDDVFDGDPDAYWNID